MGWEPVLVEVDGKVSAKGRLRTGLRLYQDLGERRPRWRRVENLASERSRKLFPHQSKREGLRRVRLVKSVSREGA